MRRLLALSLILTCILTSVPGSGASAQTVSAEWKIADCCGAGTLPFGGPTGARWRAQTFEAAVSGPVISATLRFSRFIDEPVDLTIALFLVDETDTPVGDPLYSEDFYVGDLRFQAWLDETFTFTGTTPILNSGHRYAIAVTSAWATEGSSPFALNGTADFVETSYAGGRSLFHRDGDSAWTPQDQYDLAFRVTVDEMVSGEQVSFGSLKGTFGR